MTEKNQDLFAHFEVEATPEELTEQELNEKVIDDKVPKFIIPRKQKSFLDKTKTPLWRLEEAFINEQKARRNSPHTIKHYEQTFRIFYEFLAFTYCETPEDIDKIFEKVPTNIGEKNPLVYYGKMFPILTLENDELQKDFGDYLVGVRGVSERTVETYYRDYRAFMYYAMENKIITPFSITVHAAATDIKDVYTTAEIKRLLKKPVNDNFEEYRNWVVVNYLLGTGNRINTIINLKVKDIDFEDGFININTQKNGKSMRIGLVPKLSRILSEYILRCRTTDDGEVLENEYLFCNRFGEQITRHGLSKAIAHYNQSRGVYKTSIHLFRHTYAKLWITSGGDLINLQKNLGHSTLVMVQHYSNLYSTDVKREMEKHSALSQQRVTTGATLKKRKAIQMQKI
jgi:integrase/recombinase XerD